MPVIAMLPSGINASVPSPGNPDPSKRGECSGWTRGAAARNQRFLMSVDHRRLCETEGVAFTLTVRDVPESAEAWAQARKVLLDRIRRSGATRWHWVTEWTKRGRPHLHMVVFWPLERCNPFDMTQLMPCEVVIGGWLELADKWGTDGRGQHARPLEGVTGWFAYTAKHTARGVYHYQRMTKPEGWTSTGRLWGRGGDWPIREDKVEIDLPTFHVLRRLVRSYLVAQARSDLARCRTVKARAKVRRRIGYAKRMLRWNEHAVSKVRGLGHWIDETVQEELLSAAWALTSAPLPPSQRMAQRQASQ